MNEKNVNECLYCGCYDEDFGCTMPSIDKWYACPLERNEEELREMFNMSNELIRKSDVLDLLNSLGLNLIDYDIYSQLFDTVDNMPPVNAVELPCKVGDTVYSPTTTSVEVAIVDHIRLTQDGIYLNLREWHCLSNINHIGKSMFLTREEAEKALEELRNE